MDHHRGAGDDEQADGGRGGVRGHAPSAVSPLPQRSKAARRWRRQERAPAYGMSGEAAEMSITRDNHYVPQWYQEGFFEAGRKSIAYVDMTPDQKTLPDGRVITQNGAWNNTPTSRAFFQTDLYSTFFGTSVNDEIERGLFGDVDTRGSQAVRAFIGTDMRKWHEHFQDFFDFLDIQKIRTPKGLDWLKAQYPALTQNELMFEMQGIRMLHCTIWVGGVREIVSAEDSDVKFITSDHPVTIYNHAVPPTDRGCAYPLDPGIALRGTQTIYPMDRDHCLILTNLEYAKDPDTDPLQKRTFCAQLPAVHHQDRLVHTRAKAHRAGSRANQLRDQEARASLYRRRAQRVAVSGADGDTAVERTAENAAAARVRPV
jgi:hypothetical protein